MLAELYINDFAIIDELRIRFHAGFNVLTGETGAGKSIILDAMMLVLGERADTTMVRAGCERAYVEATFELEPGVAAAIRPFLEEEGLEEEEPGLLVLARELRLNGRNICRVNGRAVTLALLRTVGDQLIDIHGQGEHLSLLRPRAHLPLLDAYGGLRREQTAVAAQVTQLRRVRDELAQLRRDERQLAQRIDLLQFQVREIRAANLVDGEEETLRVERTRLANAEQLARYAAEAYALLSGVDEEGAASASDLVSQAERALDHLARLDETRQPLAERLSGLYSELVDVAAELADYRDEIEYNPARLDFIEERLELLRQLKRKYGDSVAAVIAAGEAAAAELDQISHSEEKMATLVKQEEALLRQIGELSAALSARRQEAARRLAAAVETELADLSMNGARFEVAFSTEPSSSGAYVGEERLAFDQTGIDRLEFLISANPGEPLKPMARVASGGETARLMLALKTALAQVDETPTLIFDEIDQGIGGRVGHVVGRKLWGLTAVGGHQVVVVTHLPQLAGYGDAHFRVSKQAANERTVTQVANLDVAGRVEELAAMLGTRNEFARGGAQAILEQAEQVKAQSTG